ncbi:MAG: GtrA family protein [Maricaulaceae bacterium]
MLAGKTENLRPLAMRFVKYGLTGLLSNGLLYSVNLALITAGLAGWQAISIGYILGVLFSFYLNRSWAFSDRPADRRRLARYAAVYAGAYPLAVGLTWTLERLGAPAWAAVLVTIGVAAVGIFIALNAWAFRAQAPEPDASRRDPAS